MIRKLLLPAMLLAASASAQAHHSRAMFDLQRPVELTGTVREFQFTNPHCYIQLLVTNSRGAQEEWSVEMGAPSHLRGAGWKKTTLRSGDRIKVTIAPLRNGSRGGELVSATTVDGGSLVS